VGWIIRGEVMGQPTGKSVSEIGQAVAKSGALWLSARAIGCVKTAPDGGDQARGDRARAVGRAKIEPARLPTQRGRAAIISWGKKLG
jgi:hypothetical protein